MIGSFAHSNGQRSLKKLHHPYGKLIYSYSINGDKTVRYDFEAKVYVTQKYGGSSLMMIPANEHAKHHSPFQFGTPPHSLLQYRDSLLFIDNWRYGAFIPLFDLLLKEDDTLKVGFEEASLILEKKELWHGERMLYVFKEFKAGYPFSRRIGYVHNLGFLWMEYTYSTGKLFWRLEKINGIPVKLFAKRNPNFRLLYEYLGPIDTLEGLKPPFYWREVRLK